MAGRILIVDQDKNYREVLKMLLVKRGYTVTALEDARLIRNMLKNGIYDILFLDMHTGGTRDKQLYASIKKEFPQIHIIIVTDERGNGFTKEAMDAGAYGCIAKPFDPNEVLTMIHHIVPRQATI